MNNRKFQHTPHLDHVSGQQKDDTKRNKQSIAILTFNNEANLVFNVR